MGTDGKEREGVSESEGGFIPVLLTGTWPILELDVSQSCPKGVLRGKGMQIALDSFSVLEIEVKAWILHTLCFLDKRKQRFREVD